MKKLFFGTLVIITVLVLIRMYEQNKDKLDSLSTATISSITEEKANFLQTPETPEGEQEIILNEEEIIIEN